MLKSQESRDENVRICPCLCYTDLLVISGPTLRKKYINKKKFIFDPLRQRLIMPSVGEAYSVCS